MIAVCNYNPNMIPHLLGELGMQDQYGWTALHYAYRWNYVECANQLLDECDIQNNKGKTPLDLAKKHNNAECIKVLEEHL